MKRTGRDFFHTRKPPESSKCAISKKVEDRKWKPGKSGLGEEGSREAASLDDAPRSSAAPTSLSRHREGRSTIGSHWNPIARLRPAVSLPRNGESAEEAPRPPRLPAISQPCPEPARSNFGTVRVKATEAPWRSFESLFSSNTRTACSVRTSSSVRSVARPTGVPRVPSWPPWPSEYVPIAPLLRRSSPLPTGLARDSTTAFRTDESIETP
ncbi:hypothetical protein KM043_002386 [Ampulex compressa]|nr:hypothetical protein KM043_002386 [Ampulex compressa]